MAFVHYRRAVSPIAVTSSACKRNSCLLCCKCAPLLFANRWDPAMLKPASIRYPVMVLGVCASAGAGQAEESLVSYKSLSPAIALEAAQAALLDCQRRGYQVTVAIVDRSGVVQVILRDRYAGPHTPATASGKAWTAATFRSSTSNLFAISQPGMMQAGIRNLPGVVILGGGLVVESGGALVGAIGVSGGPGGDADDACARAGIEAVQGKLDFQ
jgi:uncharacterized protein GlcG (DUF336 family)